MKPFYKKLFVLIMIFISGSVYADPTVYPIYALTDANSLAAVMNGVAALSSSTMYSDVILAFGLAGLFVSLILCAANRSITRLILWMLCSALFINFTLGHKVSVQVVDQTSGKTYEVNNVPLTIAGPASWMSMLGLEGAKQIDAAYSSYSNMPIGITYTKGAPFSITNQLMSDATKYRIRDPYLRSSLIHFIVDCGIPAVSEGKLTMGNLLKSPNIWSLFNGSIVNPSLMTIFFGSEISPIPSGQVMTCSGAYDAINQILPKAKNSMVKKLSHGLTAGLSANLFKEILAYNASGSAYNPTPGDYVYQSGILNLMKGPVQKYMASQSKSSMLMQSLAVSQAVHATETSWETQESVFSQTFGYFYVMLQMLIYAVAPILFLFAVFPGAMRPLLKHYMVLLAWFPFTFILLGISNDMMLSTTHNDLGNIFGSYGGLIRDSQALITAKAAKMQAVMGHLTAFIPLLSWMLVEGGRFAVTSILSSSGVQTFGSRAGEVASSGNLSVGSESFDNLNANKSNMAQSVDIGSVPVSSSVSGGSSLMRANFGGQNVLRNGAPDMQSHASSSDVRSSQSSTSSIDSSHGGSFGSSVSNLNSAASGNQVSNSLSTSASAGLSLGGSSKAAATAMMAAAAGSGVMMSEAQANAAGSDFAQAKAASEKAYAAGQAGNQTEKAQYEAQSKGFFSKALDTFESMPWYEEAAVGAVAAVGVAAAFASGVGEAATVAGAAGVAGTEGAAEIGGAAFSEAAQGAGMEGSVAEGISGVESGSSGVLGKLTKAGAVGGVLGGLAKGFNGGISEQYGGISSSNLTAGQTDNAGISGDNKDTYSKGSRSSQDNTTTTNDSNSSNYQSPNSDLSTALNSLGGNSQNLSALTAATSEYDRNTYNIENASKDVQSKVNTLKDQTKNWQNEAKHSIKSRDGLDQLSKTTQQKG